RSSRPTAGRRRPQPTARPPRAGPAPATAGAVASGPAHGRAGRGAGGARTASLEVVEDVLDDLARLDDARGRGDAELVLLEEIAQILAADEVDGRCAISGGFLASRG